ncbi:MAG: Uma2 family endonuclease [Gemmatimonadaceae bacterium]
MAAPLYYTAEMVRELADEGRPWPRYETVYGELLVTPAPRWWHQELVLRLASALRGYIEREAAGRVVIAPADVSWGSDRLVQPDVFVIPVEATRNWDWKDIKQLLLVIEVLSPSTVRGDRFTKRRLYQEARVPLYWIVDADVHAVEVWTPDVHFPRLEHDELIWHPSGAAGPFTMRLEELFRSTGHSSATD